MGKMKIILGTLLGVILGIMFINWLQQPNDKLLTMREKIINDYYSKTKLEKMLQNKLGEKYKGNLEKDFNNYVIVSTLEKLSEKEAEQWDEYNSFRSRKWMENHQQSRVREAKEISGREITEKIYYLNLEKFYNGVTHKKFKKQVKKMKRHNNLIIDLRNNTGGNFAAIKKVIDYFLPQGQMIYKLNYAEKVEKAYAKDKQRIICNNIVILTNHKTASVSELFILALKENLDNVTTIGTTTLGKSISYGIREFEDGSGMLFITSQMFGPNGARINDGLKPDIQIGHSKSFYNTLQNEEKTTKFKEDDEKKQLEAAVNFLQSSKGE
ncbi:MAG: S41 family peptidase [Bacillota bacterium]